MDGAPGGAGELRPDDDVRLSVPAPAGLRQPAAPPDEPNVEARQLLAAAKVVAFFPPDTLLGMAGVVVGGALMLSSSLNHSDPTPTDPNPVNIDTSPWDLLSIVAGGGLLVGAAVTYPTFKRDAPPEKVLCDDKIIAGGQAVVPVGTLSAEHTFTETKVDANAQDVEALRMEMLKGFIATLSEVHGGKR